MNLIQLKYKYSKDLQSLYIMYISKKTWYTFQIIFFNIETQISLFLFYVIFVQSFLYC